MEKIGQNLQDSVSICQIIKTQEKVVEKEILEKENDLEEKDSLSIEIDEDFDAPAVLSQKLPANGEKVDNSSDVSGIDISGSDPEPEPTN